MLELLNILCEAIENMDFFKSEFTECVPKNLSDIKNSSDERVGV